MVFSFKIDVLFDYIWNLLANHGNPYSLALKRAKDYMRNST